MKSFFKKLAFVMALAMVVTLAAPAAAKTAYAASNITISYQNEKSTITELNIAKVGQSEDLKFVGAPSNWKSLNPTWKSSDESVATVDQNGVVTAVAAGTAVVTFTCGDQSASVKVNCVNTATYTATIGVASDKNMSAKTIEVGGEFDFAFYGIKDYSADRYFCTWASDDTSVATVDQKGLVTAVKPGTAKITLIVFNKVTGQVHNVAPVLVTVPGEATATPTATPAVNKDAFTVAQKDTDKFVLTFEVAKTVEEIRENLEVSVKIADKEYPISFENIVVDGKTATVVTYAQFENEEVYTLTYGEVKHDIVIVLGEIASVAVNYYTGKNKDNHVAYVTEEEESDYVTLVPVLYDKFGNDVTAKYNLGNFDFEYEVSSNVKPVKIYKDVFAFDAAGVATVDVTATWITNDGQLCEATGKTTFAVVKRGAIALTLEKAGVAPVGWLASDSMYTYISSPKTSFQLDPESAVWNAWGGYCVGTTFNYSSVNDGSDPTYTAVFKDNRGNLVTSNDTTYRFGSFVYESTNSEVLTIGSDGSVTFNKVGKSNILVYFVPADGTGSKKLVASTAINVIAEPYPVSYKVLSTSETTASHVVDDGLNDVAFYVQFLDQYGNAYQNDTELLPLMKVEARDTANTVTPKSAIAWNSSKKAYRIVLDGSDFVTAGLMGTNNYKAFSYKFSLEEADITKTIKTPYTVFSLTVKDTFDEYTTIDAFITATAGGTADGSAVLPANYKFNISLGGNTSKDVVVKNVIGYEAKGSSAKAPVKAVDISAKYLSSGNLAIANVPSYLLVDNTTTKATTGHVGYVYYKKSGPTTNSVAGATESNAANWSIAPGSGKLTFSFNKTEGGFRYAANGTYAVAFSTTRTEGGNLYNVKTSTVTVTNSQNQVKYLGLNPDYEGVTENYTTITDGTGGNLEAIIKEQLMFSFDEVVLGEYFDGADMWDNGITIDLDNSKYYIATDAKSVTISTLAVIVKLDDGNTATTNEYTSMVSVGARIKVK